jgi:ribonuclease HI
MKQHNQNLKYKINISFIKTRQMKWAWIKGENNRHGNGVGRYGQDSSRSE